MKIINDIKRCFEDVFDNLRICKWRAIICAVICALGVALGVALYNVSNCNWWWVNRCDYAEQLYMGGFKCFFTFFASAALFALFLTLSHMTKACKLLSCLTLFVFSLYIGANATALIACYGVFGILCVICVSLVELACYFLTTFSCLLQCANGFTFHQAFCDIKQAICIIIVGFCFKIVCFFVILRLITAFI